jgi:hypothetical protein
MESNIVVAEDIRTRRLGPFFYMLQAVERDFRATLPPDEDVRRLCDGRLFISLTQVPFLVNRVVGSYRDGKMLLDTMLSSLNLPIFGFPLRNIDGDYYIDGGITNNHPKIDDSTVLCSPFRTVEHSAPGCLHITASAAPGIVEFVVPGDRAFMQGLGKQGWLDARAQHAALVAKGFVELPVGGRPRSFRMGDHPRAQAGFFRKLKEEHDGQHKAMGSRAAIAGLAPAMSTKSLIVALQEAYMSWRF